MMTSINKNFDQERYYNQQLQQQIGYGKKKGANLYKGEKKLKVDCFWSPSSVSNMIELKKKL